ncbi:MAG: response regulator [Myxococcota bacterium]|nr:response regulator [Myxococcota bacterium]
MDQADALRRQQVIKRRFEAMGLEAGLLPPGRAVVVTLPLGPEPFAAPGGSRRLRAARFFTVGHDRIKCLAPRALFYLPLIRITDCETAGDLEERIRAAWRARLAELTRTRQWLEGLGVKPESPHGAPLWQVPLGLEDSDARGVTAQPGRVIVPSRGTLSGISLLRPEDRVFRVDTACAGGSELALAVTGHLEEVARSHRQRPRRAQGDCQDLPAPRPERVPQVLLVGPALAANRMLHEALRVRGYAVRASRAIAEAVDAFGEHSYEVVVTEAQLDRADGIELIPAIRSLPGVLDVPVALLDERRREGFRAAAKAAGASAYLSGAADASRLDPALSHLLAAPQRRRFKRFGHALSVSWDGCEMPGVTASIGRRGIFVRTTEVPPEGPFALHLPELGSTLRVESDVAYQSPGGVAGAGGVGLRFRDFEQDGETTWIGYLADVEADQIRRSVPARRQA